MILEGSQQPVPLGGQPQQAVFSYLTYYIICNIDKNAFSHNFPLAGLFWDI